MTISSVTAYGIVPALGLSMYVFTYTKTGATDTVVVSSYSPIKTIYSVIAQVDLAGADDPVTWSGATVTMSTGTGAGRMLVIGTGA